MSVWKKLFSGGAREGRVDYYEEGMDLLSDGKFHDALTSLRLALKENPGDSVILQQIAIAYTRIGMTDEAAKTYRHVLQKNPRAAGAHYGLAFLLIRSGQAKDAVTHLKAFLAHPPEGPEAAQHIQHAQSTLSQITGQADEQQRDPDSL
ncbi:MAG: tetratricopeptide repeat protein [Longimicrobiales bacterium]